MKDEKRDTRQKVLTPGCGILKLVPKTNKVKQSSQMAPTRISKARKFTSTGPKPISKLLINQIFEDLAKNTDAANDVEIN